MKISLVPVFALALAVSFGAAAPVAAKGATIHNPKNLYVDQFNQNCTDMGGTTDSKEANHTRCSLPSGTTVDCANDSRGQIDTCISSRELPSRRATTLFGTGQAVEADTLQP